MMLSGTLTPPKRQGQEIIANATNICDVAHMDDFELDGFLPYRLAVCAERVSREFSRHYRASHGMSRAEWRIVCHLARAGGGLSVRDLEREANLEKSKTSRGVSRLVERGWAEKSTHERDARLLSISLTRKGRKVFRALAPMARDYQNALEVKLTKAELSALGSALDKLGRGPGAQG